MSSARSTASSTGTTGASAGAAARAPQQDTIQVAGEGKDSVTVQSQLAQSHIPGSVTSASNLGQVARDLGSVHSASSSWSDEEARKISEWGQGEIQRILAQTKGMEEQLIAGAREKQKALDASHAGELQKLVQEMDLRKAKELKELEDGLQRQIQAALSTSKAEIGRIESEMNTRKMDLLKQAQLKSAKEIDALSNLVVETKLVPSQTRTVIETNTQTGNVVAVATGGNISTGAAQAESYSSQKIEAVPTRGVVGQEKDVKVGALVQDQTGRKVGDAAIVQTMTGVTEAPRQSGGDVTVQARPTTNMGSSGGHALPMSGGSSTSGLQQGGIHSGHSGIQQGSSGLQSGSGQSGLASGATQRPGETVPMDGGRVAGSSMGPVLAPSVAPGATRSHHDGDKGAYAKQHDPTGVSDSNVHAKDRHVDAAYGKHQEPHHKEGLMAKVKHALGVEPKSNDATNRRL